MTKDKSQKPEQDKSNQDKGRAILKDESIGKSVFIGNESRPDSITSHFSPPKPPGTGSNNKDKK
jgi:hypothetical protein